MAIFILAFIIILMAAGLVFEARSARADRQRLTPPGRLVQAGGVSMHLKCSGSGAPTIVFEAGLGDSALVWSEVQAALSKSYRTCSYDRAGIAWSEPGDAWDAQLAVEQLRALLIEAGERPPYVLVGHSAGASYARLFAQAYPQDMKGLVLVEPPLLTEIPPLAVTLLKTLRVGLGALSRFGVMRLLGRMNLMKILFGGSNPPQEINAAAGFLYRPQSIRASIREVDALPGTISLLQQNFGSGALGDYPRPTTGRDLPRPNTGRDLPLLVIAARSKSAPSPRLAEALEELSRLSSRGRVVFIPGSHFLHFDSPEVLVKYIEEACKELP